MLIKPLYTKCKNLWVLNLVHSYSLLLKPHYQKNNTGVLELLMFHETGGLIPKK